MLLKVPGQSKLQAQTEYNPYKTLIKPVMLKIKIGTEQLDFPASWKDITFDRYCAIVSASIKDEVGFLNAISGIPCDTLKNCDADSIEMLLNLSTFAQDFSLFDKLDIVPSELEGFNVGSQTWFKLEKCKQAIRKQKNYICSAGEIIKVYRDKDISGVPITECWGEINFFLKQINSFFDKYKRLSEHEETAEEFQAGIKRFEQFGFMAQAIELSRKMGKTYDEVLMLSAQQVYQTFLYDFEKAEYEQKLFNLRNGKL